MILCTEDRDLPCPLTPEELLAKGDALASTLREVEEEHERQATAKASMKERLTALLQTQGKLRQEVQERREFRRIPVDVVVVDRQKALVREVRQDTGEIIRERFADDSERQQMLDFGRLPPDVEKG